MITMPNPPPFLQDPSADASKQGDLFGVTAEPAAQESGLFAEIVFDRPLDHAFSYSVPESLRDEIEVGKRVQAPFGRGDRATVGYCVGISEKGPERAVKSLFRILDEEALLTPNLLRLTRWMADYYLCGWGQVLNVVVPAGAREKAGIKATAFLEAVPEAELPQPPPTPTAKQAAALEVLRRHGQPMEPRKLARLAKCGSGPVDTLVAKGLARRVVRRIDTFAPGPGSEGDGDNPADQPRTTPLVLNADQVRAWTALEAAVYTGGFHAFLLYGVTGSGKTELYLR